MSEEDCGRPQLKAHLTIDIAADDNAKFQAAYYTIGMIKNQEKIIQFYTAAILLKS